MDGTITELNRRFEAGKLLGYLNFSDGRPDHKFRRALADAQLCAARLGEAAPWRTVGAWLTAASAELANSASAAFHDLSQAQQILASVFGPLPDLYRAHHEDLLRHQPDSFLFGPFFMARACEAALQARAEAPSADARQLARAAIGRLNDYVGYRPIAVLETRPQTDFYGHEKVCPVPIYFAGAGVADGEYADLVRPALELLERTNPELCEEACWNPALLEELAIDPRAADHFHPVNKRPNVLFGEWDPHRIDSQGRYRRFILKQPTLAALLHWAKQPNNQFDHERLFESAAVLAGTILMGAGVSGSGPNHYDSEVTLAALVQKIARYRDLFYRELLDKLPGTHGERLRSEAARLKQPFAGVRQFLNQAIATERALHLQERRLALLLAAMGFAQAARSRISQLPAPSVRFGCEIRLRQTEAEFAIRAGQLSQAVAALNEVEELLRRGIDCGALIDPWNILGFQGLFPIFTGQDDTVRDPRAEELILTIGRQFDCYAQALAASVTSGGGAIAEQLRHGMNRLAEWWDRFATTAVSDLPRVHGGERAAAAEHVSTALALWKTSNASARDVRFWRAHREGFRSPAAFAQVIDALLEAGDFKAALALLITWLSERSPDLPLQDPAASFSRLASRWLRLLLHDTELGPEDKMTLLRRFFELLEANADDLWQVPVLAAAPAQDGESQGEYPPRDEETYASAYEGMSYRDSTDDGIEGPVADGDSRGRFGDYPLENHAEGFEERLRFLAAVGRFWRMASRADLWSSGHAESLSAWLLQASNNLEKLEELITAMTSMAVPAPTGGLEGVMEYDRRRMLRSHLLDLAVGTAVEMGAAQRRLAAALSPNPELAPGPEHVDPETPLPKTTGTLGTEASTTRPGWEAVAIQLERAIGQGDAEQTAKILRAFVPLFRHEPLLTHPPADGGEPRPALRAQSALQLLESLLVRLPRLGLLRENYQLCKLARQMERNNPPEGRRISSFDQLFRSAVTSVVQALAVSYQRWRSRAAFTADLRQITESFHKLWLDHSQSLRLTALEAALDESNWHDLKRFVRKYGSDLFTVRFLTLSNIRGILGQGVRTWLDSQADPQHRPPGEPLPRLIEDWGEGELERGKTVWALEIVLQSLVEYYDEYRDYNTTTTQSDYGENLYILLDFLRLKASYDRIAWRLKPLVMAHEVLCLHGLHEVAAEWRAFIAGKTSTIADDLLARLAEREAEHGLRLRTIRDRLEERFVAPLQVDQAAARIATAASAASTGANEDHPAFRAFLQAVQPLAASPVGVGLEVPAWLRRLEDELRKARAESDDDSEAYYYVPVQIQVTPSELKKQLADWERPLTD